MPDSFRRWSLTFGGLALVCLGFVLADRAFGRASAQAGAQQLGNSVQIENEYRLIATRSSQLSDLMKTKDKKVPIDMLEKAAKYHVYRVTWVAITDAKAPEKGDPAIVQVVNDFNKHVSNVLFAKQTNGDDPTFVNAYAPVLVAAFKDVTDLPVVENAKAIVHLTQMMPALARLKHDSVSKYLIGLMDEKSGKSDVIKLGAVRALREFMPVDAWDAANAIALQNKSAVDRKKGDIERIDALTKFILRPAPTSASREELEAYRYLRREAIETLGQAGAPAVGAFTLNGKAQPVEGPIAPLLVRVLMGDKAADKLVPTPNLAERNEAALGLCNMVNWERPAGGGAPVLKAVSAFDPNPTYYYIGRTFNELLREYMNDFANIAGGEKLPTAMPWKYCGKRWELALERLAKNAPPNDKNAIAVATTLEKDCKTLARIVHDKKSNVNNLPPLPKAPPPQFLLFKPTAISEPLKWEPAGK